MINARGKLNSMNQIEKWAEDGVILVNMSGVCLKEAQAGNNPERTKKALSQIFTFTDMNISPSDNLYCKIESVLFLGGAQTENQKHDTKIVFEAAKYQAILIRRDGGSRRQPGAIIGNRDKLRDFVKIMTDTEAVPFIRDKINERDNFNKTVAREYGGQLPDWTGKD
jgi:hypothetical protein